MKKIIFVMLIVPLFVSAQKNKISFGFGYSINSYKMDSLNQNYIDSFLKPNKLMEAKIQNGKTFFLNVKYQPNNLFDLGLYGNYQFGKVNSNPVFIETDIYGNLVKKHIGDYTIKTEAISFGIVNNWYINYLLKFQEKENKFLQNSKIVTELNFGYGFSQITNNLIYPTLQIGSFYDFFTATGYQGLVALRYEYEYLENPIIGTIGIKVGYQYFVTDKLNDKYNEDWKVKNSEAINLDFSGLFYSVYMTFGK